MLNPYQSTGTAGHHPINRRPVRRWLGVAAGLILIGGTIGIPAAFLLNQKWQLITTSVFLGGFEANGQVIPDSTVILYSTVGCLVLVFMAVLALCLCVRNLQSNRLAYKSFKQHTADREELE